jgi:DNA-directed RNA polymerase subunit RPC12/RpoP
MRLEDEFGQQSRRRDRPRTPKGRTSYFGAEARKGVPIQCQYCSGQTFRRSTLRSEDLSEIFLMRYPVRCLRCSQRQMVSFTIASLSLSSSVKPKRRDRTLDASSHWKEPSGDSGVHKPSGSTSTHE